MRITSSMILAFSISFASTACVRTFSSNVRLNDGPQDDRAYSSVYEQSTRSAQVIENFGTKFELTATYLSPEFRSSFAQRFERLYEAPQPFLDEATSKAGFFISMYTPATSGHDLTNAQLWSIHLKLSDTSLRPILVRKIDQKDRWIPFFPAVHRWSQEYLVLFDTPSVSLSPDLVAKKQLTLSVANADARVQLDW